MRNLLHIGFYSKAGLVFSVNFYGISKKNKPMMELQFPSFTVALEIPDGIFKPTTTTQLLVKNIGDVRGKVVLDLGCGSGPVAISAALMGAEKVYAVDIMAEACEATRKNARLNGVSNQVEVLHGSLFEPIRDLTFDIIVDDVSGMADEVSRISPWYPRTIPTGGCDGTAPTVTMLRGSRRFLHNPGYLLFPVISLSRSELILSTAKELYPGKLQLLTDKLIPFCDELRENLDRLEQLKDEGIIHYIRKRSRYFWSLSIYKAEA